MKQFQYHLAIWQKTVVPIEGTMRDLRPEIEAWMNSLGAEGWDIFAIGQQQVTPTTLQVVCNCKREVTPTIN